MKPTDWASMFGDSQGHPQSVQRTRTEKAIRVNETMMRARIRQLAERTVEDAYRTMSIRHVDPAMVAGCLCRARPSWEDPCVRCGRSERATIREGGS